MSGVKVEGLAPEDFDTVAAWLSHSDTNRWLTSEWRGRAVDRVLVSVAVRNKKNRFYLARFDGTPAALVGLSDIDTIDQIAMIWYVLGDKSLHGRGVTTDAVRQVLRIAFEKLQIESVYAWIIDGNTGSQRVLEKTGFHQAGRLHMAVSFDGRRVDRIYFDRIRADLK